VTKNVRDIGTYICPYIGFINKGCPGCTIHSSNSTGNLRDISFYGEKICSSYHCPANSILTDCYKNILLDVIDDWFLYSLVIIDPESFIWLADTIMKHSSFVNTKIDNIKKQFHIALDIHLKHLNNHDGAIFYYSISEYNLNKHSFSLLSGNDKVIDEREEIIRGIQIYQ
jgi:hypothetical protein